MKSKLILRVLPFLLASMSAWAQVRGIPDTPGEIRLQLRTENGQTRFYIGETIPLELVFSASNHHRTVIPEDCEQNRTYIYRVKPGKFISRADEISAAGQAYFGNCHGWLTTLDLAEKPLVVKQNLNDWFRMETPGKYQVVLTSTRVSSAVTSNVLEIEIEERDPEREKQQLANAIRLMGQSGKQGEGCKLLRYLATAEAELEMARHFTGDDNCSQFFDTGLISAKNRKGVLDQLEAGLVEPDRPISASYIRTLALVSLYQQHPDWLPQAQPTIEQTSAGSPVTSPRQETIWSQFATMKTEEVRYAQLLNRILPQKTPSARAESLKGLIYLNESLRDASLPSVISPP